MIWATQHRTNCYKVYNSQAKKEANILYMDFDNSPIRWSETWLKNTVPAGLL